MTEKKYFPENHPPQRWGNEKKFFHFQNITKNTIYDKIVKIFHNMLYFVEFGECVENQKTS